GDGVGPGLGCLCLCAGAKHPGAYGQTSAGCGGIREKSPSGSRFAVEHVPLLSEVSYSRGASPANNAASVTLAPSGRQIAPIGYSLTMPLSTARESLAGATRARSDRARVTPAAPYVRLLALLQELRDGESEHAACKRTGHDERAVGHDRATGVNRRARSSREL